MALHLPKEIIELKIAITRELAPAHQANPGILIDLKLWEERADQLAEFVTRIHFENPEDKAEFQLLLHLCYDAYTLVEQNTRNRTLRAALKHKKCFVLQVSANAHAEAGYEEISRYYSQQICRLLGADQLTYLASLENRFNELLYLAGAHLNQQNYPALAASVSAIQAILSSPSFKPHHAEDSLKEQQSHVLVALQQKLIAAIQQQPELAGVYQEASRRINEVDKKRPPAPSSPPPAPSSPPPAKRQRTAAAGSMGAQKADLASYARATEVAILFPYAHASTSSSSSSSSAQAAAAQKPSIITPAAVAAAAAAANADAESAQIAAILAARVAQQAQDLEEATRQRATDAAKISELQTKVDFSEATRAKTFRAIKKSTAKIRTLGSTILDQAEKIAGLENRLAELLTRQIELSRAIVEAGKTAATATALIEKQQQELNSARAEIAALKHPPAAALSTNGAGLYGRAAQQQPEASDAVPKATGSK